MIGVFDSGIGGLSVLKEINKQLPEQDFIYIADTAFTPYGEKSREQIIERSFTIVETLIDKGATVIVVACNTATAIAVDQLRVKFQIPIVAMEPAVKPGVQQSRKKKVGILATTMTLASHRYIKLLEKFASDTEVIEQPCPGLVEKVEAMQITTEATHSLLHQYIDPLLEKGIDTIVLGCTHYPFLKQQIKEITGNEIEVIDTAKAVTEELIRKIDHPDNVENKIITNRFFTTGEQNTYQAQLDMFWPFDTKAEKISVRNLR